MKLDQLTAELLVWDEQLNAAYPPPPATAPTSTPSSGWPAARPELYWGYFSANARIRRAGRWAERHYVLAERYHPYALGGGYVVSRGAARWVAAQAPRLVRLGSEDVAMGLWLSTMRELYRRHDVRFDTAWLPRRCAPYHLVLHKRTVRDMKMVRGGAVCSGVEDEERGEAGERRPVEYFYDWSVPVGQCCGKRVV